MKQKDTEPQGQTVWQSLAIESLACAKQSKDPVSALIAVLRHWESNRDKIKDFEDVCLQTTVNCTLACDYLRDTGKPDTAKDIRSGFNDMKRYVETQNTGLFWPAVQRLRYRLERIPKDNNHNGKLDWLTPEGKKAVCDYIKKDLKTNRRKKTETAILDAINELDIVGLPKGKFTNGKKRDTQAIRTELSRRKSKQK